MSFGGGTAYGGSGNDVGVGSQSNDIFIGDDGDDVLYGYAGNDYFYGGAGNDAMYGGDGVDVLIGGAGNDYFDGGQGINYYFGGNGGGPGSGIGNDVFVVNDVPGVQVVQDWTSSLDTVQFNGSGFTGFADVLAHSYQNGAYLVVQVDADTAVWLNGATANTVTANNFTIVS
jgi:Ca2+-binding RTX toxin-like protein